MAIIRSRDEGSLWWVRGDAGESTVEQGEEVGEARLVDLLPGRPEGGDHPICTAGVEEDPGRDFSPDCERGVAQNDQRGVMGDEGSGEVGGIEGNDVHSRPQHGDSVGDGVAVGVRLDGN
jgi:hypothetical protein